MMPSKHIALSAVLGTGVWLSTQSFLAGLLCLLSGVLSDVDHIIEYMIHYGLRNVSIRNVYIACQHFVDRKKRKIGVARMYLFFHAIEISLLFWTAYIFSKNIYALALALGYTGHLFLDIIGNPMRPRSYFITVRMRDGFETNKSIQFR